MDNKLSTPIIRLKTNELMKAAIDLKLKNDTQLAAMLGISVTQLWRVKLQPSNPQYNAPGATFIAGVLNTFKEPFEKFFFLDESVARSRCKKKEVN